MSEEIAKRHHQIFLISSVAYLSGVSAVMLRHNVWFSPDQFFIFALVAALFLGKGKRFIRDWTPVMLVFASYEFFRGALPLIAQFPLHSTDLIAAEKFFFGAVPTIELQKKFLDVAHFRWYDFLFSLTYMSFWVCPFIFAFFLWIRNQLLFRFMTLVLFVALYATFITVFFFPTMPPWMAAEKGFLPVVHRVLYSATAYLTVPGALPTFFSLFRGNDVAAIPSMHMELPTLMLIFAILYKNKLIIFLTAIYFLLVYVAIIYLGEHYVIDGLAGILYALVAFVAAKYIGERLKLLPTSQ